MTNMMLQWLSFNIFVKGNCHWYTHLTVIFKHIYNIQFYTFSNLCQGDLDNLDMSTDVPTFLHNIKTYNVTKNNTNMENNWLATIFLNFLMKIIIWLLICVLTNLMNQNSLTSNGNNFFETTHVYSSAKYFQYSPLDRLLSSFLQ